MNLLLFLLLLVPSTNQVVVPAGTTGTNGDIKIQNTTDGTASARLTPKDAKDATNTTATTEKGFHGTISSLETGDTVNLGTQNVTTVTGTGGTVNVGNNSTVTITNTAPAGGASITITYPTGSSGEVPPGSTYIAHG